MIEIGVFHNGASDLPVKINADGVAINDGDLRATQESAARVQVNQVRQGILADRLGFDYFFLTEHHFQPEGAEYSPNPLLTQTAIAAQTKRIRLGQAANIITWHHPVRIAEQAAMLDVISGGRLEFGIGRGYQPRETEVLGGQMGATIQDQERNRAYFEEAYEIILKCWTQDSFSHHGEFFTIPPTYTRWNHRQTIAYFQEQGVGRSVEDVLALGDPDMYSMGSPVLATTTKLRELQVYPQPVQKPHPQMWEPVTSPRSVRFAAQQGMNGYFIVEPNPRLQGHGAPLHGRGRAGRLARPARPRAVQVRLGLREAPRRDHRPLRAPRRQEHRRHGPGRQGARGAVGLLRARSASPPSSPSNEQEAGDIDRKVTAEELRRKGVALHGSADFLIEEIMKIKEICGYEDFLFNAWFELGGFSGSGDRGADGRLRRGGHAGPAPGVRWLAERGRERRSSWSPTCRAPGRRLSEGSEATRRRRRWRARRATT